MATKRGSGLPGRDQGSLPVPGWCHAGHIAREFAQVFSAGGTLDSFFNDNLRAYVDTGVHPWRWRGGSSGDFGLGNAPLRQFERAAEIRDSYFVGTTPNVGFTLTPTALDGTTTVTLTTDGQSVWYDGRKAMQVRLQWPGLAGSTGAGVVFAAKADEAGSGPVVERPMGPVPPARPGSLAVERHPQHVLARFRQRRQSGHIHCAGRGFRRPVHRHPGAGVSLPVEPAMTAPAASGGPAGLVREATGAG